MRQNCQLALIFVTCSFMYATSVDAFAERTIVSSSALTGMHAKTPNDGVQVAGFWDWLKELDEKSSQGNQTREHDGGAGGDGAGGAGGGGGGGGSGGDGGGGGGHG